MKLCRISSNKTTAVWNQSFTCFIGIYAYYKSFLFVSFLNYQNNVIINTCWVLCVVETEGLVFVLSDRKTDVWCCVCLWFNWSDTCWGGERRALSSTNMSLYLKCFLKPLTLRVQCGPVLLTFLTFPQLWASVWARACANELPSQRQTPHLDRI